MNIYNELSTCRRFEGGQIPTIDIITFCNTFGYEADKILIIVRQIDNDILEYQSKKRKEELDKNKN